MDQVLARETDAFTMPHKCCTVHVARREAQAVELAGLPGLIDDQRSARGTPTPTREYLYARNAEASLRFRWTIRSAAVGVAFVSGDDPIGEVGTPGYTGGSVSARRITSFLQQVRLS